MDEFQRQLLEKLTSIDEKLSRIASAAERANPPSRLQKIGKKIRSREIENERE